MDNRNIQEQGMVRFQAILNSAPFQENTSPLAVPLGTDAQGNIIMYDFTELPHVMLAGAVGSGMDMFQHTVITSLLYHTSPAEVRLILIDPKVIEFYVYRDIPHLLIPVINDPRRAVGALNWALQEMQRRYDIFAENGMCDLEAYHRLCREQEDMTPLPQIVIAIEEFSDLMAAVPKETENAVCRLAQRAGAVGIHLMIATQRPPSGKWNPVSIQENIPGKAALRLLSGLDSERFLGRRGAEELERNEMLYLPNGRTEPVHLQICRVSIQEIEQAVDAIKKETACVYDESVMREVERLAAPVPENLDNMQLHQYDAAAEELIEQAIEAVITAGYASVSQLQRRLKLGYARAARIMDELEEMGIIGPYEGAKPRRVLLSKMQYEERKLRKMNENQ